MIFSCGPTYEERSERRKRWHRFFPLFPRTLEVRDGKCICVCWQWIERSGWWVPEYEGGHMHWEYRIPQ